MTKIDFVKTFRTFFEHFSRKIFEILKFSFFKLTFRRKNFRFFSISKKYFSEIEKNRKIFLRKVNLKNENFKISENFRKIFAKKRSEKNFEKSFLHDKKIFFIQIFFYDLEYTSTAQKTYLGL